MLILSGGTAHEAEQGMGKSRGVTSDEKHNGRKGEKARKCWRTVRPGRARELEISKDGKICLMGLVICGKNGQEWKLQI